MKYHVTLIYNASSSIEVEADSIEAATQKAHDEGSYVALCHQCSTEIEVGDAYDEIVYDEQGNQLYPETQPK